MILMDTCAILWDALDPAKLSSKAQTAIDKADESNTLMIADISLWEIAMLVRKKRLTLATSPSEFIDLFLQSRNITVQSITADIAELSVNIGPEINSDPADRLIAATAILNNAGLVTADQNLLDAGIVKTIW